VTIFTFIFRKTTIQTLDLDNLDLIKLLMNVLMTCLVIFY